MTTTTRPGDDAPLTNFSNCHVGIVSHLQTFGELPALLEPAARARKIAEETLHFFRDAVYEHHSEEEKELFPAVLASAVKGEEREKVQKMVDWLTAEHRDIEALWASLEPQLKKLAKGQPADVDPSAVEHLVRKYSAHAKLEEDEFLPLSEQILGRNSNHMAALGLSLHMRHVPRPMAHI
jgi:hemerythrin superfamily protein